MKIPSFAISTFAIVLVLYLLIVAPLDFAFRLTVEWPPLQHLDLVARAVLLGDVALSCLTT